MCIRDRRKRKPKAQSIGVLNSIEPPHIVAIQEKTLMPVGTCLLYTSDAADERSSVDLGGRRIIKKTNKTRKA